jgi:hypothetical protein
MQIENTFSHQHGVYDLSLIYRLMRQKKVFLLPIKDLLWVLAYDKPSEERIRLAKHRYPLLVVKDSGRWVVVDGLHRLEKYRRKGINMIPVREIPDDILKRALIPHRSILDNHKN